MAAEVIGKVKAGRSGKTYEVKWNSADKNVYVSWATWTKIGQANSAREAMTKAEAWLYDK
jgi:hypothetical protein